MHRLLYILFLLAALSASAQKMPERREVRKGNRSYHKGDYKRAIERYTRALTYDPASNEATYDLGNALYKAEMLDKAEQTMARAAADTLRTDDERAEAFYNLGNAQFQQKKYKEALESYRRSLLLDPADMEAKYNYAYTKKLLENDQEQQGGGDGGNDDQKQDQNRQNQDQQDGNDRKQQDPQHGDDPQDGQHDGQDPPQPDREGENDGEPHSLPAGISEQEQQQMLDAIQAQEDKTQDKLKEKQGRAVRGRKNW
ncbi:MAG: tetratricopeptide repeat protein [Alistipes sp.]|nr:tetratricopeptide repeat protein [Alistipes senegalensis]MCM1250623.1 tetratricopeptide repeat protein [Alistipes sp.]